MKQSDSSKASSKATTLSWILLYVGVLCIGLSPLFIKIAAVPGSVAAYYRVLIAGIIVVPLAFSRKSSKLSRIDLLTIIVGGIFFAVDLALWNASLLLTSAATATFLANNAPLWTALGAMLFFKEKLSYRYWIGLVIALSASVILIGKDALITLTLGKGAYLALAASVFYAAYLLTTQNVRLRVGTLKFMAVSTVSSSVVLLVFNILTNSRMSGFSPKSWSALIGIGLISHLGGWLCINYALGHLKASQVSISLLGQVVIAAILAIPILGEGLSVRQIAGGILLIAGIYIVNNR